MCGQMRTWQRFKLNNRTDYLSVVRIRGATCAGSNQNPVDITSQKSTFRLGIFWFGLAPGWIYNLIWIWVGFRLGWIRFQVGLDQHIIWTRVQLICKVKLKFCLERSSWNSDWVQVGSSWVDNWFGLVLLDHWQCLQFGQLSLKYAQIELETIGNGCNLGKRTSINYPVTPKSWNNQHVPLA